MEKLNYEKSKHKLLSKTIGWEIKVTQNWLKKNLKLEIDLGKIFCKNFRLKKERL